MPALLALVCHSVCLLARLLTELLGSAEWFFLLRTGRKQRLLSLVTVAKVQLEKLRLGEVQDFPETTHSRGSACLGIVCQLQGLASRRFIWILLGRRAVVVMIPASPPCSLPSSSSQLSSYSSCLCPYHDAVSPVPSHVPLSCKLNRRLASNHIPAPVIVLEHAGKSPESLVSRARHQV